MYHHNLINFDLIRSLNLQDFIYPQEVAYPIGGPGSQRYLVMQVHYDNPMRRSSQYQEYYYDINFVIP
jgi:hypothetical protein